MSIEDILEKLESIRDDAYWSSGCSHEDALQDSLKDIEKELGDLIEDIQKEYLKHNA